MWTAPGGNTCSLFIAVCLWLATAASLRIHTQNDKLSVVLENSALLRQPGLTKELDVLANDTVVGSTKKSCLIPPPFSAHHCTSNETLRFEEKAETAHLNHQYRNKMATRPHCVFDFAIPGGDGNPSQTNDTTTTATLDGEFCIIEHMSAGVAAGDYNNDGLVDLYFTVFHGHSVLYKNNGNGTFKDVTRETGIGPSQRASGAVWLDADMDGDLDLYVTSVGNPRHFLYISQDGQSFTEEAIKRGVSCELSSGRNLGGMSPSVGDYDMDGYPDIYITEWILRPDGQPSASRLFRNKGHTKPGYFEDTTVQAGVDVDSYQHAASLLGTFTFASSFTDFDSDGCPDLAITADYGGSRIYWNNCNGTFTHCTKQCGIRTEVDAMGHAIGDLNGDGQLDWFSTGIHFGDRALCQLAGCTFGTTGNAMFLNANNNVPGRRAFLNVASKVGVQEGNWGWGAAMLDFDNDKYTDIVMTNGFDLPSTSIDDKFMYDPMKLWKNPGPMLFGRFTDVARDCGLTSHGQGRGLVRVDYDGDGDEDIVVAQNTGPPLLYENVCGNTNDWIKVQVKERCPGKKELCDSLHARVVVTTSDGWKQTQEIGSSTHYMGQSELTAHFGLGPGPSEAVDVIVQWPRLRLAVHYLHVERNVMLLAVPPVDRSFQTMRVVTRNMTADDLTYCSDLRIIGVHLEDKEDFVGAVSIINNGKKLLWHAEKSLEEYGVYGLDEPVALLIRYYVEVDVSRLKKKKSRGAALLVLSEHETVFTPLDDEVFSLCDKDRNERKAPHNLTEICRNSTVRRFDGFCNHRDADKLTWSGAGRQLRRDVQATYLDGIRIPPDQCGYRYEDLFLAMVKDCRYPKAYAGRGSQRPSPRLISNELFHQVGNVPSRRGVNDLLTQWGQFITHDIDHTSKLPRFEYDYSSSDVWIPISVPKGDIHFDLDGKGDQQLPFVRSIHDTCSGFVSSSPREQLNGITSVIDGSVVYGSLENRASLLRTHKDGKLKTESGDNLPFNTFGVSNDNNIGRQPDKLLATGDVRANVQPGMVVFHTIFVREHNRWCEEYKKNHSMASDEEIFQFARRMVAAELQAITFREFLPVVLGRPLAPYFGYEEEINPDVGHIFSVAAFRFGHSQVNTHLWRLNSDWSVSCHGHLPLRDAYFRPERVLREGGIDPYLRGFVAQPAQEVDLLMVDDMRNFLFPVGAANGEDLAALDIQRGRDHGLPDYNTVRKQLGLKAIKSFEEITDNPEVACKLRQLYGSVDNIDLFVGGMAERHIRGGEIGETFAHIIEMTFLRLRRGDRFWYENIMTPEEIEEINKLSLSEVIRHNSGFFNVPDEIFFHWTGRVNSRCETCQ